jgi:hypothetical protein
LIDYTKIKLSGININRLKNLCYLDFKVEVSTKTGELSQKQIAVFHFCKITIYESGAVYFTGSIHKFWNSYNNIKAPNFQKQKIYNGYNGNQFKIDDIIEVRRVLQNIFDCSSSQMVFENIEFGINTEPNFNIHLFMTGLIMFHGNMFEFRWKGNYAEVRLQRYRIKIYNKSYQYGMNKETLRVETHINKMEELKLIGIKSFEDINTDSLNGAFILLLKQFKDVIYYDNTIKTDSLSKAQENHLNRLSNPLYWASLQSNRLDRPKKTLQKYIELYSDNLKQHIKNDLQKKCVIINRLSKNSNCVSFNLSDKGLIITLKCPITGLDLKNEKEGAIYARTATLKHLRKTDREQFLILKNLLLGHSYKTPKFEQNEIKHMAKQIRNKVYNPSLIRNHGYKQKVSPNQMSIF